MYNLNDMQEARRSLNRCRGLLASICAPLLAAYVLGMVKGWQVLMLMVLLAGFGCVVFICDMKLLPALRYVRFLKEMGQGLRRSMDCVPEALEAGEQMQDGVRVRALHVRLAEDGDSRILYVNVSKLEKLPPMNTKVRLTCYGRHVVDVGVL